MNKISSSELLELQVLTVLIPVKKLDIANMTRNKANKRDDIRDQKAVVERLEKQTHILQTLASYYNKSAPK